MREHELSTADGSDAEYARALQQAFEKLEQSDSVDSESSLTHSQFDEPRIQELVNALACPMSLLCENFRTSGAEFSASFSQDSSSENGDTMIPKRFGHYEIIRPLGHGGMGMVYLTHDTKLNRQVALKLILPQRFSSKNSEKRFLAEARANAAAEHPNIVKVFEAGRENGTPYLAMEFIDAKTLAEHCFRENDFVPDSESIGLYARWLEQVARATEHVHRKGLLHRDIKPANILIRCSDDIPFLADFGLAKVLDETMDLTVAGDIVGSPNYLAPEQVQHGSSVADHRSDIYGLGITLYAALTGATPHADDTLTKVFERVKHSPLKSVRDVNSAVSADLSIVCEKATEKNPGDRYESAADLADDINRALNRIPIKARPITWVGRSTRWVQRNRQLAFALSSLAAVILGVMTWSVTRPAHLSVTVNPADAEVRIDGKAVSTINGKINTQTSPGLHQISSLYAGYEPRSLSVELSRGRANLQTVNFNLVKRAGGLSVETVPSNATVSVVDATGVEIARGQTPWTVAGLPSGPAGISIEKPLFQKWEKEIEILKNEKVVSLTGIQLDEKYARQFGSAVLGESMFAIEEAFSEVVEVPGSTIIDIADIATKACGRSVSVDRPALDKTKWSWTRRLQMRFEDMGELSDRLRLEGLTLAWRNNRGKSRWWITSVENAERTLMTGLYSLESLALPLSANQLQRMIQVNVQPSAWEQLGGVSSIIEVPGASAISVSTTTTVHRQVAGYLTGLSDFYRSRSDTEFRNTDLWTDRFAIGQVRAFDEAHDSAWDSSVQEIECGEQAIRSILFLDEQRMLVATDAGEIQLWDLTTQTQIRKFEGAERPRRVNCLIRVRDDEDHFAAGDGRGNIWIYDAKSSKPLSHQNRHIGDVTALAISPDRSLLYSAGADGNFCQYAMPEFEYQQYGRTYDEINDLVAYDDETVVYHCKNSNRLSVVDSKELKVWDQVETGDLVGRLSLVDSDADSSASIIIAGQTLSKWTLKRKRFLAIETYQPPPSPIWSIATHKETGAMATLHHGGQVAFRDAETLGIQVAIRPSVPYGKLCLVFSPAGKMLAISGWAYRDKKWKAVAFIVSTPGQVSP